MTNEATAILEAALVAFDSGEEGFNLPAEVVVVAAAAASSSGSSGGSGSSYIAPMLKSDDLISGYVLVNHKL